MRADANGQYVEVTADFRHYIDDPHVDPGFTREPLSDTVDVVIVGGGFGGLSELLKPERRSTSTTAHDSRD